MIPFIKTDRSIGKSIIQIDTPNLEKHTAENPDTIVTLALQENWKRVYIVDDDIGGFLPCYKELKKHKIQLCYGQRISITDEVENVAGESKIVLFVTSEAAYKALIKITSFVNVEGGGRLTYNKLHELWHPELILGIPFYDSFLHVNSLTKRVAIPDFRNLKPFVLLEDNGLFFDAVIQGKAESFAKENNLQTVWSKTIYYNKKSDVEAFQIKKLMNRKEYGSNTTERPNLEFFMSDEFCIESWKESKKETNPEFEKCFDTPLSLFLPGVKLPDFDFSEDDKIKYDIKDGESYDEILRKIAREGMKQKIANGEIPRDKIAEYSERAKSELEVLKRTRFSPYICLVWDVMNFITKNQLSFNPGRGSAPGSLINWLTGVTFLDPIKFGLYMQRFISESRAQFVEIDGQCYLTKGLPDIDCDVGHEDRIKVYEFLCEKYKNRIAKVSTVGTLTTKELVTEMCKISLGFNKDQAKMISDMIPVLHGVVASPQKAYQDNEQFKEFCDKYPGFLTKCLKLHNSISEIGKHASAVMLGPDLLENFMPLCLDSDGEVMTAYDQYVVQELCIKLDLLGVKNTTVIHNVCKLVGIDPMKIPFDSEEYIYKPLNNLENPWGLFQIGGHSAVSAMKKIRLRPEIASVSDIIAIIRPGAAEFIDTYARVSRGLEEPKSLHPLFDKVLERTYQTCLYQEDLMALFHLTGLTLTECDDIRRIISKKLPEEMAEWKDKIYETGKKNNIPVEALDILWRLGENSASYQFNKCLHPNTLVETKIGFSMMKDVKIGETILSFNTLKKKDEWVNVINIYKNKVELFNVIFSDGRAISCSLEHKFMCSDLKKYTVKQIFEENKSVVTKYKSCEVISFKSIGLQETLDFEVDNQEHTFYANNLLTSNSHSCSYGIVAAQSVYLKNRYPKEFFMESLKVEQGKQPKKFLKSVGQIVVELSRFGIKLLPPSLIKGNLDFAIEGNNIRFGLSAIKGAGGKAAENIGKFIASNSQNKFDIFNAVKECKVGITIFSALAEVGALDELNENRHLTVLEYRVWDKLSEREKNYCLANGSKYDFDLIKMLRDYLTWTDKNGKLLGKESRLETLRKNTKPFFEMYKENAAASEASQYLFEKTLIGYSFSYTLKSLFNNKGLVNIEEIKNKVDDKNRVKCAVNLSDVYVGVSKKGNKKISLKVHDETGEMNFMMIGEKAEEYLKTNTPPKEGQILFLEGRKDGDIVFLDNISPQHLSIVSRVQDLKKLDSVKE